MSPKPLCPTPEMLGHLIEGKIVDPDLSELAEHLEGCSDCQTKARTLFSSDTLVESLRSGTTATDELSAQVPQRLMDALKLIPAMDSDAKLSADGLARERGMSLDDLGLSFLSPPQEPDEIGRLGHYRVLAVLGRGGMGAVFLAEDPKLGRRVALKVMLPKIASIPAARDRFLREAKAAASLHNDHIVTVYQVDEFNGVPFLAMELLEGESLEQALQNGRRFSIAETIGIARDVARGLADAHEKGLVHRDIKPGNLWLEQNHSRPDRALASSGIAANEIPESTDGDLNRRNSLRSVRPASTPDSAMRVKILDFGLARAEVDDVHITEFGTIVGTPAFMAPEQARADRAVDGRADLFSLGCVLYVLCTGDIPFKADTTVGTLMALALNTPVAPDQRNESVPAELSKLTMQLLEKDPAQRPKSAREVTDRLTEMERSFASGDADTVISRRALAHGSQPDASAYRLMQRKSIGRSLKIATGLLIAALMFIAAEVFLWQTPDGKVVRIESNDPSIKLAFGGGELKVTAAYDQPVTLKPGKVDLKVTKTQPDGKDFEFETDKLVVRKGDQIVLKIEVLDGEVRIVQEGKGLVDSMPFAASTEQYEVLIDAMRLANPGFEGMMMPRFEDDHLVSLDFKTDNVTDISPLRDLKHLRSLRMVSNFSPGQGISDLSPLQGLPLTGLYVYNSFRVTDLSPLKGMPLQELITDGCPIADLSPLAGMQLRILRLWNWNDSDLSSLKGMPLTELNIGGNGKAMDLTPLAGAPLEYLCLNSSKVSDLSPLTGMPLTVLLCENTLVSDLSPVRDAKLTEFAGDSSRISDILVLQGMPITAFHCDVLGQRELHFLRGCKTLENINFRRAADVLREFSEDPGSRAVSPAFTNNIGMEFEQVPKGKAWLIRRETEERMMQKHETIFEQDFYLGAYEVTQEEWSKVIGANPSWFTRNADGANEVKTLPDEILKRLPVERVSWLGCQEFLKRLNELDQQPGWTYRLPTEAEWQFACRGGPMTDASEAEFDFYAPSPGNELSPDHANFARELGWNRPCRVGLFAPNKLGLYDMHGNVGEWCDDKAKWLSTESRLLHAGSWSDSAAGCRTSRIEAPTEPWTYYDLGLRVARVPL